MSLYKKYNMLYRKRNIYLSKFILPEKRQNFFSQNCEDVFNNTAKITGVCMSRVYII